MRRAENEEFTDRRRGDPAHRASVVALHLVYRARAVPVRRRLSACPELDCVRHRLPPDTIAAAERRALELGVGADRVLIAARAITEDAYVVALAAALRVPYEPLDRLARGACPLTDAQLIDADKNGLLPLEIDGELVWIIAPRALTARRLIAGTHPIPPRWMRLTSARRLRQFVIRHCGEELAQRAANGLRSVQPELSAASHGRGPSIGWVIAGATLAIVAAAFPRAVAAATSAALAFTFLAWTGLRMLGAVTAWQRWRPTRLWPGELPVYTIIVALYDEADAAAGLIAALGRLDYPALGSKCT